MRIIGGELGGRSIRSIERKGLRPTTERVRESIFNILAARLEFDGLTVLDLFAGTGALGIEALSRGAATCTFVELDRKSATVIQENLESLRLTDRARVANRDALKFLSESRTGFDLIFADPPYAATLFDRLLHDTFAGERLNAGGIFVLEHSSGMRPRTVDGAVLLTERDFGDTGVSIFGRSASRTASD